MQGIWVKSKMAALLALTALAALLLSSCQTYLGPPGADAKDWNFIQSVGGIKLGAPYYSEGVFLLPVEVDVSGGQTVTVSPTLHNTGLVCASVTSIGRSTGILGLSPEMNVDVTILTNPAQFSAPSATGTCPDLVMPVSSPWASLFSGFGSVTYNYYYRHGRGSQSEKYFIGSVEL